MNKPLCYNLQNIDGNKSLVYISATEVEIFGLEYGKKNSFWENRL